MSLVLWMNCRNSFIAVGPGIIVIGEEHLLKQVHEACPMAILQNQVLFLILVALIRVLSVEKSFILQISSIRLVFALVYRFHFLRLGLLNAEFSPMSDVIKDFLSFETGSCFYFANTFL